MYRYEGHGPGSTRRRRPQGVQPAHSPSPSTAFLCTGTALFVRTLSTMYRDMYNMICIVSEGHEQGPTRRRRPQGVHRHTVH
ncbi:unnamed protein product, partial [Laminaria digitata]